MSQTARMLIVVGVVALSFGGCAFVESATELTFSEDSLPAVEEHALMTVSEINEQLESSSSSAGVSLTVSESSTWADLRDTLCNAAAYGGLDGPKLVFDRTPSVPNLTNLELVVEVDHPGGDAPCTLGGIHISVMVDFIPFTTDQAQNVRDSLNTDVEELEDAILQMRFRFDALGLMVGDRSDESIVNDRNELLDHFLVELSDETIEEDEATPFPDAALDLVPFFLLRTIQPNNPQRFELPKAHPVTASLIDAIVNPGSKALKLHLDTRIDPTQLERIPVDNSGIAIDFQFEVVISVLNSIF